MSTNLHGYTLAGALREEAEIIMVDERAALVRQAADEIELLIRQNRTLQEQLNEATAGLIKAGVR